jgi:glycosyltransferase involved in cell wall biosynthesis
MRVLLVTNTLVPAQLPLWRAVKRSGVDLHILGSLEWGWSGHLPGVPEAPDWAPAYVDRPIRWRRDRGYLWWTYPKLPRLVRELAPDIVHIVNEPWSLLVLQALRNRRGSRVVAHSCDNIYAHGGRVEATARLKVVGWSLRRLDGLVSWNAEGVILARAHGLRADRPACVVPAIVPDPDGFSISADERKRLRGQLDIEDGHTAVGFVGRLTAAKGLHILIDALAWAAPQEATLLVYGAGPEEQDFRRLAAARGVQTRFCGPVDVADIPQVMAGLDLLVVPSLPTPGWVEQFGRVAVEGMLAGVPVIVSDSGALPEVVGAGGVGVPAGDIDALGKELRRLIADDDERRLLGALGRGEALARFSPSVLAKRLHDYWSSLLNSR